VRAIDREVSAAKITRRKTRAILDSVDPAGASRKELGETVRAHGGIYSSTLC
jgi:hypothetical protein